MTLWLRRIARWTLLALGSVLLFVLVIDSFYPIALTPTRHVSRVVTGEEGAWLYTVTDREGRWRFPADLHRIDPL